VRWIVCNVGPYSQNHGHHPSCTTERTSSGGHRHVAAAKSVVVKLPPTGYPDSACSDLAGMVCSATGRGPSPEPSSARREQRSDTASLRPFLPLFLPPASHSLETLAFPAVCLMLAAPSSRKTVGNSFDAERAVIVHVFQDIATRFLCSSPCMTSHHVVLRTERSPTPHKRIISTRQSQIQKKKRIQKSTPRNPQNARVCVRFFFGRVCVLAA